MGAEEPVQEQHDLGGGQRRQDEERHRRDGQHGPHVDRQPPEGHPRRPHRGDGRDQVDRRRDRSEAGDEHGEVPVVGGVARGEGAFGKRRICEPADGGGGAGAVEPVAAEEAEVQQRAAEQENPEPERVQPGKGEIPRADHQRDQIVGEAEDDRDPDQEDHRGAVQREQTIERFGRHEREAGPGELQAHERGLDPADHEKDEAGHHVHDAEALVVDRDDPVMQGRREPGGARCLDGVDWCGSRHGDRRHGVSARSRDTRPAGRAGRRRASSPA